jgi:hypothetical protein
MFVPVFVIAKVPCASGVQDALNVKAGGTGVGVGVGLMQNVEADAGAPPPPVASSSSVP